MPHVTVVAMFLLAGGTPQACSDPPRIASGVQALHGPVVEQATYKLAEVREMAQRSGVPLRHDTLGFYLGGFGQEILIDTEKQTNVDGSRCDFLTTVTVRLSLVNRLIEVASDLQALGCHEDTVLQHYRRHAVADDKVLSEYVQPVNNALRKAWPLMQAKLGQAGDNDLPGLRILVQGTVERVLKNYDRVRTDAIAAVDTPQELESLVCGSRT